MRLHEYTEGSVDVLELEGEIDMHFAPVLRRLLQGKRDASCPALLLDMSAVEFIDSTGLAVILEYVRDTSAYDGRFCIGGVSANLRTIFEIVRLDRAIPIYRDAATAKNALISGVIPAVSEPLFASAA
jgi:anti-sigma B factor antagonist